MAKTAVKALMQTLAAGSKSAARTARQQGFTLLELMVVLAIAALLTAAATLALPSAAQRQLEQEAQRMAARLEIARAQSRASGQAMAVWVDAQGMRFSMGASAAQAVVPWLHAGTSAQTAHLVLGPEPVIAAQQVQLSGAEGRNVWVATDGVRPFQVQVLESQ